MILIFCIDEHSISVPLANQTPEDLQSDEQLDCQVMELIRDEILPQATNYPPSFISKIMALLNKGSIHLAPHGNNIFICNHLLLIKQRILKMETLA